MSVKPELLAPAGSWESLVAAVENGADAVYLGGKLFNARQSAGNFDQEELSRAVEFAHVRGVKVYVTVNILLDDQELPEAAGFLYSLQQCGADAAIVQDLGLARLARQVIPELPLHASTQMTTHNLPAALLLKEAGIDRVVLARELSLEAIKEIRQQGGVEVEVFIHGALCVCYSGQCLMSSLIGGRSGNRGRCAQPCRLNYVLVDQHGRPLAEPGEVGDYLLSPRDLNLSEHLPDLIEAGITSFKIEGRMKRPEYVATVVRIYRELLDRAAVGGNFTVSPEATRDLAQIFNRDFSTGYFYGRPGRELMSYKRPNNRGVRLGRIKRFDRNTRLAEISLEEPLRVGDGIEVWVTEGGRAAEEDLRAMTTLGALRDVGRHLSALPGRKSVIWLTAGLSLNYVIARMPHLWHLTLDTLNDANVAVYSIDSEGVRTARGFRAEVVASRTVNTKGGLGSPIGDMQIMASLADATGGRWFANSNDLTKRVDESLADSQVFYRLAYRAARTKWDGAKVNLEVKVPGRKDIEIRHRRNYIARAIEPLEEKARDRVLADAIISPLEAVEIGVTARLTPVEGSDESMVRLTLDPGSVTLAESGGRYVGRMDIRWVQATVESKVIDDSTDEVNLNLALAEAERTHGEGFNYQKRLRIQPDAQTLKIAFCDHVTGRVGSLRVEIPGAAKAAGQGR